MDAEDLSLLGRRLGPSFDTVIVTLAPGDTRRHDDEEWRGALVVVEAGEIHLECRDGGRRRFGAGDVLWLAGLGLVAVHNHGTDTAVLVGVSRRCPADETDPPGPSRPMG